MIGVFSRAPGGGAEPLPRTVHLMIARRPRRGGVGLDVSVLREGAGIAWRRAGAFSDDDLRVLRAGVADLHRWAAADGMTRASARRAVIRLGRLLRSRTLGAAGTQLLADLDPTALLVTVDETLGALPWELLPAADGTTPLVTTAPVGRLVTSTARPLAGRDPLAESPDVHVLVVAPATDLPGTHREVEQLRALAGTHAGIEVTVEVLSGRQATIAGLRRALRGRDVDVLHLAGHGRFDDDAPAAAGFRLTGGWLDGQSLSVLRWAKPPAVVVNTSCTSARVAAGRGLLAARGRGLPAAAIGAGVAAYLGFVWPVRDQTAATFAAELYTTLLRTWEAGDAITAARQAVRHHFVEHVDLAAVGSVLYGDVAAAVHGTRARPSFVAEAS